MPYKEWQKDELDRLVEGVKLYTKKNRTSWSEVSKIVATRTPRECQDRYLNRMKNKDVVVTKSNSSHITWTDEECELLKDLVALHGHKWSLFVDYFPGRDANKIKSKYYNGQRINGEMSYDTMQYSGVEQSISWKCSDFRQVMTDPRDDNDDEDDTGFMGDFYDPYEDPK